MALDLERPSAAVPTSSRSSSPQDQRSQQQPHTGGCQPPLKFSIQAILSPDFGRKDTAVDKGTKHEKETLPQNDGGPLLPNAANVTRVLPALPAWIFCSRISDRPSSGPRARRIKKKSDRKPDDKRPRTAFSADQLSRLKQEFAESRYLTEKRRQDLARDLHLNESQIKIWFQNRRAKLKKQSGTRSALALQLMAQGLYNHSTIPIREDDEDDEREKNSSSS